MTRTVAPVQQDVSLDFIDPTGGTQMRVRLDDATVLDYAERMAAGDEFPPIVVFQEGKKFWLADGFHRFRALRNISARTARALVHVGDRGDAIEYAIGANKSNGLRRTNGDKQMAVRAALAHERLREMSDRAIADLAGVDHKTVSAMRRGEPQLGNFPTSSQPAKTARTGRDGKEYRLPRNEVPRAPAEDKRTGDSRSTSAGAGSRTTTATTSATPPIQAIARAALRANEIECPHCHHVLLLPEGRK